MDRLPRARRLASALVLLAGLAGSSVAAVASPAEEPLHKLASGEVSADGRTYTDRVTGFSLRQPAHADGWVLDPAPPTPGTAVQLRSADGAAFLDIGVFAMGRAVQLEDVVPKAQSLVPKTSEGYHELGTGYVGTGPSRCFALRYQVGKGEGQAEALMRVYAHGTDLLVVGAFAPAVRWAAVEPAFREILASFTLLPPASPLGPDGRTYTDAARGISLRLPAKDWRIERRAGGLELFALESPDKAVHALVRGSRLDPPPALPALGQSMAAKLAKSVRDHGFEARVLRSEVLERAGRRAYEIELEKQGGGETVREVTRLALRGSAAVSLTLTATAKDWTARAAALRALLDSFTLVAPGPQGPAPR